MDLEKFQNLAEQVIANPCLTLGQQEDKIIQLVDLARFIECYKSSIDIVDYMHHEINVVDDNGIKKGIFFYDFKKPSTGSRDASLHNQFALEAFREYTRVNELWFVFVARFTTDLRPFIDCIAKNKIDVFYDRIFLFDFFQPAVHELK